MALRIEHALVDQAKGLPAFALNPISGSTWVPPRAADRVLDGEAVYVLERNQATSTTTFMRSHDGGRTWVIYQVHDLLRTVR